MGQESECLWYDTDDFSFLKCLSNCLLAFTSFARFIVSTSKSFRWQVPFYFRVLFFIFNFSKPTTAAPFLLIKSHLVWHVMTIWTVNATRLQEENVSTMLFIMPTLLLRVHSSFVPSVTVTCSFLANAKSSSDSTVEFLCAEFNTHSSLTQQDTMPYIYILILIYSDSIDEFYQYRRGNCGGQ